jgi:hypothetical protein
MIIKAAQTGAIGSDLTVAVRCPGCGHQGTFLAVGINDLHVDPHTRVGLRKCPNSSCQTLLYYVSQNANLVQTFPFLRIDFDRTNIPPKVLSALEEAVSCHANQCYMASAIMVRKSLDLLCVERGASGSNLKEKIAALGAMILIPKELLDGMDDLRLLGNDAAHIESQVFDDVGEKEVEIGIEFTKEIMKAVYQYSNLLAKLKSLKKNP